MVKRKKKKEKGWKVRKGDCFFDLFFDFFEKRIWFFDWKEEKRKRGERREGLDLSVFFLFDFVFFSGFSGFFLVFFERSFLFFLGNVFDFFLSTFFDLLVSFQKKKEKKAYLCGFFLFVSCLSLLSLSVFLGIFVCFLFFFR